MKPPDRTEFDRGAVEDELRALSEAKWHWATDDQLDRLEDLFDDELVFVHLNGYISSKAEWMGELRTRRFVYERIEPQETSARALSENAGVVVGRGTFTVNGGLVFPLVCTEVYTRQGGQWKVVNLHACASGSRHE
jgi:Domain of unknown function (DUF4440)